MISGTDWPQPLELRFFRLPLSTLGFVLSLGVMESTIAITRVIALGSRSASRTCDMPGSMDTMLDSGPIFLSERNWSRKSSSVNWFFRSFRSISMCVGASTRTPQRHSRLRTAARR